MNYLITGGAGFIGCNYAHRLLGRGETVTIYDNLSRLGTEANLSWLRQTHGEGSFRLIVEDVRDEKALLRSAQGIDVISRRNKSNRLEEMFLQMVEQGTL